MGAGGSLLDVDSFVTCPMPQAAETQFNKNGNVIFSPLASDEKKSVFLETWGTTDEWKET